MTKILEEIRLRQPGETIFEYEKYLEKYYKDNKLISPNAPIVEPREKYKHEEDNIPTGDFIIQNNDGENCLIPNVSTNSEQYKEYFELYKKHRKERKEMTKTNNNINFVNQLQRHINLLSNGEEKNKLIKIHDKIQNDPKNNVQKISACVEDEITIYNLEISENILNEIKEDLTDTNYIKISNSLTAIPKEFNEDLESVEEYETYVARFYTHIEPAKNYTINAQNQIIASPINEQRNLYPHENKNPYKKYYEEKYLPFLKEKIKQQQVERNKDKNIFIREKITEKIAELTSKTARTSEEEQNLKDYKDLLAIIPETITGENEVELLGAVVGKDNTKKACELINKLDLTSLNIYGIPQPKPRSDYESTSKYEEYLLNHYKEYLPSSALNEHPMGKKDRKEYPHELFTWQDNKTPHMSSIPNSYYNNEYKARTKERRKVKAVRKPKKNVFKKFVDKLKAIDQIPSHKPIYQNLGKIFKTTGSVALVVAIGGGLIAATSMGIIPVNYTAAVGASLVSLLIYINIKKRKLAKAEQTQSTPTTSTNPPSSGNGGSNNQQQNQPAPNPNASTPVPSPNPNGNSGTSDNNDSTELDDLDEDQINAMLENIEERLLNALNEYEIAANQLEVLMASADSERTPEIIQNTKDLVDIKRQKLTEWILLSQGLQTELEKLQQKGGPTL